MSYITLYHAPRQKRREASNGLTAGMRRALVVAKNNNGLVRLDRSYRASFLSGAEKVKFETVQALLARALLMRSGENLVGLTSAGKVEAERTEQLARKAADRIDAARCARTKKSSGAQGGAHAGQFHLRLPYADD